MVVKGRGVDGVGGGGGDGDLTWPRMDKEQNERVMSFIYLFFVLKSLPVEEDHQSGRI